MPERLVVIGAGMASGRLLEHLTEEQASGFDITLINAEPRGSYNRILLSPVLSGEKDFQDIITHDDAWYASRGVTTRFGESVSEIDRNAKVVHTDAGTLEYDKLVIATGSNPVVLPLPGHDAQGVISYRDIEDTQTMMATKAGQSAVVIGGGLLGLEAAAGLAARGAKVTVVHLMGHLMERQLDQEAAGLLQASLEARGITILCSAQSKRILDHEGHVSGLELESGDILSCNLLVMAVGIRPAIDIAKNAGLKVDRAIVVSDQMRTSDPSIFALGECVEHRGTLFGLVAPLYDQAKVLSEVLSGRPSIYAQKTLSTKLKVTGCDLFSAGDFSLDGDRESVVFRDPNAGTYKCLVIEDDHLIGAVIYGDTSDGQWFFDLIRSQADIGSMRDTLIFGPAYNADPGGSPPDPFSAVAAWRREPSCNAKIHAKTWASPVKDAA